MCLNTMLEKLIIKIYFVITFNGGRSKKYNLGEYEDLALSIYLYLLILQESLRAEQINKKFKVKKCRNKR